MPEVIQNFFVKCGFSAASSVKVDDKDKNCTWVNCKATQIAPVLLQVS